MNSEVFTPTGFCCRSKHLKSQRFYFQNFERLHAGAGGKTRHQSLYGLPMNVGESSCRTGVVFGAALAEVAKPARRRVTRESRTMVFIKGTPV